MPGRNEKDGIHHGGGSIFNQKDMDIYRNKNASSETRRSKEALRNPGNAVVSAVKNLLIAMETKAAEDVRFREEAFSSIRRCGALSKEQLSFIVNELKISRTDRNLKSTQISELKCEVMGLKNDLELFQPVLQSVLGGGSRSSLRGSELDDVEKETGATEHVKGCSGRATTWNAEKKNNHLGFPDIYNKLSSTTSQSFRGGSRTSNYENDVIILFEAPPTPSDMPAEMPSNKMNSCCNGSATELPMGKTSNASSCDSSIKLRDKRKHSSDDDNLEGLQKKSRNDSCSDDNLAELQQMKKKLWTGEHPLLKPTIVSLVLQFAGKGLYLFVCGVHKVWKPAYEVEYDSSKYQTHTIVPLASISVLNYAYDCGLDMKNARFKSKATGSPLSLSWWSGHIAPYSTIIRFHELRKGDPMNICGGAASAGRLEVLRTLIKKQKWNCDDGSICINAAESPSPNVLQWLFLNGIGKWDVISMAAMLRSAALFNRHMNAHFLSLIPKFRSGIKERKQKAMCDIERKTQKQLTNAQSATTKPFSLLGSSAVNCSSTTKRHPPVSTDSALGDIRLPNLEKKDLSPMSKGNSDDASLKKKDMMEIAMAAIDYVDEKYLSAAVTSSEGVKVNQSGGSSDEEKDNNKARPEANFRTTSEKGAGSGAESIDKAPAIHGPRKVQNHNQCLA